MDKTPYYLYILISSFIKIPSTFLHEMAHVIAALMLGCRVKGFSIFPKIEDFGCITFGEVQVGGRFPGVFFIVGMAPIIWNILAFYLYISETVIVNKYLTYVLMLYLISAGIPSYQDLFIAGKGLKSFSGIVILILMALSIAAFYFLTKVH